MSDSEGFSRQFLRIATATVLAIASVHVFAALPAFGQSLDRDRVLLAGVQQDVAILRHEISQLRLEVERVTRENEKLRKLLFPDPGVRPTILEGYVQLRDLDNALTSLRMELTSAVTRQRSEIVAEVSHQIERLAKQTEMAMKSLAESVEAEPEVTPSLAFASDFPKKGIAYSVKWGDTLSGIAREHNSTVRDIKNANKISDPKNLQAGQTIFIPKIH